MGTVLFNSSTCMLFDSEYMIILLFAIVTVNMPLINIYQ